MSFKRISTLLASAGLFALSSGVFGQQASLQLLGGGYGLCNHQDTIWRLTKTSSGAVDSSGNVVWTVSAIKSSMGLRELRIIGFMSVRNNGAVPAPIGNVVVNLQRHRMIAGVKKWVSASVDVADATSGDAATVANISSPASQEDPSWNANYNAPSTYAISGSQGTFTENAGSGTLNLTDVDSNSVLSLVPQPMIAPGQTVNLIFDAEFNNSALGIPAGEDIRPEIIVSFGNAGGRGGSGASSQYIDINGNGQIDANETWVRSVPYRISTPVPALEICNQHVTLTDTGVSTTGTVTYTSFDDGGYGAPGVDITGTTSFTATAHGVDGGVSGGTIANTATLVGEGDDVTLQIGLDELGNPIFISVPCCVGTDLSASNVVTVGGHTVTGHWTTYTQGAYGNSNSPGYLKLINHPALFPAAIGNITFTTCSSVLNFLPAGGPPSSLNGSYLNPLSTSGGVFAGQMVTMYFNLALSGNGTPAGFGNLYYHNAGDSLNGKTVAQIYAICIVALNGGSLPSAYTMSGLNSLATNLNESWDNGAQSAWAVAHLSTTP
jgi:hypothetical protein